MGLGRLLVTPGVAGECDWLVERQRRLSPVGLLNIARGAVQGQGRGEGELVANRGKEALGRVEGVGSTERVSTSEWLLDEACLGAGPGGAFPPFLPTYLFPTRGLRTPATPPISPLFSFYPFR